MECDTSNRSGRLLVHDWLNEFKEAYRFSTLRSISISIVEIGRIA